MCQRLARPRAPSLAGTPPSPVTLCSPDPPALQTRTHVVLCPPHPSCPGPEWRPALRPAPARPSNRPLSREPREVGRGPVFPQACPPKDSQPPSNSEAPYMSIHTHPRRTTAETVSCCLTQGFAETARRWRNRGSASACQPPSAGGTGAGACGRPEDQPSASTREDRSERKMKLEKTEQVVCGLLVKFYHKLSHIHPYKTFARFLESSLLPSESQI